MQFQVILTSVALLASLMLPHTAHARTGERDDVLTEMSQAYKKGDRKRLSALLPQARGHVLEPWAAYWELTSRLDTASNSEVQAFFSRYAGSYQEDRLRNDWLLQLGRRREFEALLVELPKYRMNDDRAVRCYGLLAEATLKGTDVSAQVAELWLAQKEADDACAAAAEQQYQAGKLKASVVWQRARLGFENERVKVATQAVDILNPKWAEQVGAVYASPVRFLDDKVTALRAKTKELVTLALIRLAATDASAAADELNKIRWRTQLTHEERSWVWGVVGKRAASRLTDGAINYFSHAQDQHLSAEHLAWKVRAGLRAGNWPEVLSAINAMPEPMRQDSTWVYWRARAILAQQPAVAQKGQAKGLAAAQSLMNEAQAASPAPQADATTARQLLESIASNKGFYEQLALEELGRPITVPEAVQPLSATEKEAAQQNPGLRRALYAIQMGLRPEGVREWNYTTNLHTRGGMSDRELLAAAQLACDLQVWDRCINTSERTKAVVDMTQRYPMPFKQEVVQRAGRIGLDAAYVYGLIRQESRFVMDAQSHVGAAGLMQVMPATAKWTAKKIGLSDFKPHQITERDTNITIGTGYLKLVLDSFEGSMPLAAAAYNAGPSRSRNWRGQDGSPTLEAAIWAENVPFNETRDYVKKVLANTTNYAALLTGKPQSLKARLGTIGPQGQAKFVDEDLP